MAALQSKQDLADYCLRANGAPVVNIEIDDEQLTDCLDLAVQYYQEYHFEGIERDYVKYQLTADDMVNQYLTLPDPIFSVLRVLNQSTVFNSTETLYNFQYQIMQNEMQNIIGSGGVNYMYSVMNYLQHMDFILRKEKIFRFNRRMNKIFLDVNWGVEIKEGEWVVLEVYRATDPEVYSEVYNDMWLKKYAAAVVKKMWGTNLKKFSGMTLPGGIQYNGQQIYDEAVREIEALENEATNNSAPLGIFTG
jgi:hypothetical protein